MPTLRGACHCGNIEVELATLREPEAFEVRACACSFCRLHGARTITDRDGRLRIVVHDERELVRYRFGLATADFLICRRCGVYVAAVVDDAFATLRVDVLRERKRFAAATPVAYDGEDPASRVARRRETWTPASVIPPLAGGAGPKGAP